MNAIELRDYQDKAIFNTYGYLLDKQGQAPLIVAPAGSGKSIMIAVFIKNALAKGQKVLVLGHIHELIEQNVDEFVELVPDVEFSIYSAGLGRKELNRDVVFAGIQSIAGIAKYLPLYDLVIIDEAHMVPFESDTRYRILASAMLEANPKLNIIGLTATPHRLDGGYIHKGDNAIFDGISYEIGIRKLINDGYLVEAKTREGEVSIDVSRIKKHAGEYAIGPMALQASNPVFVETVINDVIARGQDRKSWLVFACNISHANILKDKFRSKGIDAEAISCRTPSKERDRINGLFKAGKLRCLVSVNTHTTGFNSPNCDLIAIIRATMSSSLYVQMVGRGMRKHEGKTNCLVLDYGTNVIRHGFIDSVNSREKEDKLTTNEPLAKVCPECGYHSRIHDESCSECGHVFVFDTTNSKLTDTPYDGDITAKATFFTLLDVLCKDDVTDWLAHAVQNPDEPSKGLIIKGSHSFANQIAGIISNNPLLINRSSDIVELTEGHFSGNTLTGAISVNGTTFNELYELSYESRCAVDALIEDESGLRVIVAIGANGSIEKATENVDGYVIMDVSLIENDILHSAREHIRYKRDEIICRLKEHDIWG